MGRKEKIDGGGGGHREGDRLANGEKREDRWWGRESTEKEIDWGMGRKEKIDGGGGEYIEEDRLGNGEKREDRWWGRGVQRRR
ncbi:hypothetical protein RRG08_018848 [Elysia crispata]|uniref:Uncharacterized protein n=1 Tax=Elysia crispata TaxID=231223 RepID=A0AAE1B687_9GAST|nr:hypothetical protein RRG08_018848 [Elysia crispata]